MYVTELLSATWNILKQVTECYAHIVDMISDDKYWAYAHLADMYLL